MAASPPAGRCSIRLGMATDSKDRTLYHDWKARRERLTHTGGVSGRQAIEMRVFDSFCNATRLHRKPRGQHGFLCRRACLSIIGRLSFFITSAGA